MGVSAIGKNKTEFQEGAAIVLGTRSLLLKLMIAVQFAKQF